MTTGAPLRVGVVGVGGIAQMMHLPTLAERSDLFQLVALADVDEEALAAVGKRYQVRRLYRQGRELVEQPDVEAVLLLASGSHRDLALAAMAAAKHLFVEKPLGFGLPATEELVRAAEGAPGVVMVGYHKRYDPAYQRAREAALALRDLRSVEVTVLHPDDGAYRRHHTLLPLSRRRPAAPPDVVEALIVADACDGPLKDLVADIAGTDAPAEHRVAGFLCYQSLIHDINLVRGVLGEPEEVLSWHTWRGGLAQSSLTRFPGDVCVSMNWVSLPGLRHYEETVRFLASDGRVRVVFPSPYLRHFPTRLVIETMEGDALVEQAHTVSYEEAFRCELLAFYDCVATSAAPETSVHDALGDARWIQAMLASAPK